MSIMVDSRWQGVHGIGHFSHEVRSRLSGTIPLPVNWPLLHPAELWAVSATLVRTKPEVYFSPGFNPPIYSPCPFVFTIHDLIHLRYDEGVSRLKWLWQQLYYLTVVKPAARKAFKVITVSEFSKSQICEWARISPEQVVVVGSGLGPNFSPAGPRLEQGTYLLYVGNQKPHKNVSRLVRAFAAAKIDPSIRLILSGAPSPAIAKIIEELRLHDRVHHAGFIPESELPTYLRGALAFVFPSLCEGFGLPPLEAMACGTPVVTSRSSAIPEVVGDAAVLVDPEDVESIAEGIRSVVNDSAFRESLKVKGIERAKLHTWDRTAALVAEVLEAARSERSS